MSTKIITMPRSDWSGRNVDVVAHDDGSFDLMGYTFSLVEKTGPEFEDPDFVRLCGKGFDIVSPSWTGSLGTVWVQDNEAESLSGDLSRSARSPMEAAVQILCNII